MIDKTHKDYPEYAQEWENLRQKMIAETDGTNTPSGGFDGGDYDKIRNRYREEFKALQMKYSYLFK